MQISFALCLPRDELSVPVVRRTCCEAMRNFGVERDCMDDVALALTEACANVVRHSRAAAVDYEVQIAFDEDRCEIRVIDPGWHLDRDALEIEAAEDATSGRGIALMRAMVDVTNFDYRPEAGTVVHLVKRLTLTPHALLRTLAERRATAAAAGPPPPPSEAPDR
ncbi:MAG TPA: ATP-binding protein [Acidimicrobiales bacterium]|nr:ATP-binding protein [Acidimicrobiales bacterium]